jgi:hypothetical protein
VDALDQGRGAVTDTSDGDAHAAAGTEVAVRGGHTPA